MLTLTENAANKIWQLISAEDNLQLKLRVSVMGGGCSGLQYGFAFVETLEDGDTVHPSLLPEVKIVVDALSAPYLQGAEVDYVEELHGAYFSVNNPNAKAACSCGASFCPRES
jgi:iron-sulfur cluster insertion protein